MANNYYSVKFGDYDSLADWGLYLTEPVEATPPEPQTHYVTVPGRNGSIDLTEALNGKVAYNDRTLTFSFVSLRKRKHWKKLHHDILNAIHGKSMKIILSDDPGYYYEGRVFVEKWSPKHEKGMEFPVVTATVGPCKWERSAMTYVGTYTSDGAVVANVQLTPSSSTCTSLYSDLRFGTAAIPLGDFSKYGSIVVEYTYNGTGWTNLQFVDASGNVYNTTLSDTGTTSVDTLVLTNAGLDITSIYRILVTGGQDAVVYGSPDSDSIVVQMVIEGGVDNSEMVITVSDGVSSVTMDGTTVELDDTVTAVDEFELQQGDNTLTFFGTCTSATITVAFYRGWL